MKNIFRKLSQCLGLLITTVLLVGHGLGGPGEYRCDRFLWAEQNSTCVDGEAIATLKGKTTIEGHLVISGTGFTDLGNLSELQTVTRDLIIKSTVGLTNLQGLENLKNIGGKVDITANQDLKSLSGWHSPAQLQGFKVFANPQLQDLMGVDALQSINGDLIVNDNSVLPSLAGLNNIQQVKGSIRLSKLYAQTDLYELRYVKNLEGSLIVSGLPALISLKGLEELAQVSGSIEIGNNPALLSLNNLVSLTNTNSIAISNNQNLTLVSLNDNLVLSSLQIGGNQKITTFTGLKNISKMLGLTIEDSPLLENIDGFYQLSEVSTLRLIKLGVTDLKLLGQLTSADRILLHHLPKPTYLPAMPLLTTTVYLSLISLPALTDLGMVTTQKYSEIEIGYADNLINLNSANGAVVQKLSVHDCQRLTSISGPSYNSSYMESISLRGNPLLQDISALSQVEKVGVLEIKNNATLSLLPLGKLAGVSRLFDVINNPSLCQNTVDALLEQIRVHQKEISVQGSAGNKVCN